MTEMPISPRITSLSLEGRGVEVEVHPTEEAVRRYNERAANEPAGALIHSTC